MWRSRRVFVGSSHSRSGRPAPVTLPRRASEAREGRTDGVSDRDRCVWQHVFRDFAEARREITAWIRWYNTARPHQALGYRSPTEWRAQQLTQVA
jgi:transposase InsO family protein